MAGELPANWKAQCEALLAKIEAKAETIATRKASQNAIEGLAAGAARIPRRLGRPDRLQPDQLDGREAGARNAGGGNYINYGVREFGMAAIINGMALHGGLMPFGGTFLTFSDYARNALRMAALMKLRTYLRVHARLDRPGRGRPDAPVGRARRRACA